jgi:hypothetical protein
LAAPIGALEKIRVRPFPIWSFLLTYPKFRFLMSCFSTELYTGKIANSVYFEEVRRQVDAFHPAAEGVRALSERVRQSFDPKGILNRGRMRRGT